MHSYVNATFSSLECRNGVCVVDGYGVQVRVGNRCLIASDGIGRFRRERSFPKALVGIKRLIIVSHEGVITLEALRWLSDAGIAFLQIDRDGELIAGSANYGLNDPRLRRALALAATNATGPEIARRVLTAKLAGQEMNLARPVFPEDARAELAAARITAANAASLSEMLVAESSGAAAYWGAWKDVYLCFARKDEKSIPEHWRIFGQRSSPITNSPRSAANPANAMLNYLYALLEAETRLACLACGLDPGLGVFHVDQNGRDSLALDLMEAVRPKVDAYLLDLLGVRTFSSKDFVETRKGVCRVLAPLTHTLAETTSLWAQAIAPVVENVAAMLAENTRSRSKRLPTPLTQSNRCVGRDGLRRRPKKTVPAPRVRGRSCVRCGAPLAANGRLYCDDCLPEEQQETLALFEEAGPAALAKLRAEGHDPTKTTAAKEKVGRANSRRLLDASRWNAEHGKADKDEFTRAILPGLQGVPLSRIIESTGLSLRYCSQIRRGRVPHPAHWRNLRRLASQAESDAGATRT